MKLRVWWIRNPPSSLLYFDVPDVDAAKKQMDRLAKADLKDASISSNVGGLEVLEEGMGWTEYYDDDGRDISEIRDEEE